MKLKNIIIYSVLIFTSTFVLVEFSQRHLQHSLTQSSNQVSQQLSNPIFSFQSQFSQYSIDDNSINQQLINAITSDLKLDADGWSQFGTFDLVHPTQVKFI